MRDLRSRIQRKPLFAMILLAAAAAPLLAADKPFSDILGAKAKGTAAANKSPVEISVELLPGKATGEATLRITARMPDEHYIYSMNDVVAPTSVKIDQATGLEPAGEFQADHPPKIVDDPDLEQRVEKYYDRVTWTRPYRLSNAKDAPAEVSIRGLISYQVCNSNACRKFKFPFEAKLAAAAAAPAKEPGAGAAPDRAERRTDVPVASADERFEHRTGAKSAQQVAATWTVSVRPRQAKPGDQVTITVGVQLEPGWHVYAFDQPKLPDGTGPMPTVIGLTSQGPLVPAAGAFDSQKPIIAPSQGFEGLNEHYYEKQARWTRTLRVPEDAAPGEVPIEGKVAWQLCNERGCQLPIGFAFGGALTISDQTVAKAKFLRVTAALRTRDAATLIEEWRGAASVAPAAPREFPEPPAPAAPARGPVAQDPAPNSPAPERGVSDEIDEGQIAGGIDTSKGLLLFLAAAALAGFGALLTPCVFPMIPITVSFFQKQSEKEHHRPVSMASVYCLGIMGTFTVLGMLMSAIFGAASLNQLSNNPWLNLFIAGVLIFFAFNLLGLFDIRIPSWLLTYTAGQESRGGYIGVLFMSLTFTLTSFTCTFAFVGGLLGLAANGDRFWPVVGLLAFSAAFSMPFFFLALFPSFLQKLPKSGGWMNIAKVMMGLIELGAAFKFLSVADFRWHPVAWIFDYELVLSAWMVISITGGLYLLGLFRLPHDVPTEHIGVVRFVSAMSFLGLAAYLGVGIYSPHKPSGKIMENIVALAPPRIEGTNEAFGPALDHGGVKYALDYRRAAEYAARERKPLFVDFTGVNCANCRKMEKGPLSQPRIVERLKNFVCVQVYTDRVPYVADNAEAERLLEQNLRLQDWFGDSSLPSYAVVPPEPNIESQTVRDQLLSKTIGYDPDEARFARFLDAGLNRWKRREAELSGARVLGRR